MSIDYLSPFVVATQGMLATMLELDATQTDTLPGTITPYISGVIMLEGQGYGQTAIVLSRATATQLVAKMLMLEPAEVDEAALRDGVGEMINIVAGSARKALVGTPLEFRISLPSIIVGENHQVTMRNATRASSVLKTPLGEVLITVSLVPKDV